MNASTFKTAIGSVPDTTLLRVAAGASAFAGLIHYAVVPEHRAEWWLAAIFFTVVGGFQIVWAALVCVDDRRMPRWAGIGVNAAILVIWLVSRTAGMPFGPDAGEAEPVGVLDTLSCAAEFITVAALLVRPRLLPSR